MDLKAIENLIKFVARSGTSEVKLEMDDIKITIKTGGEDKGETTYINQYPMGGGQTQQQVPQQQQQSQPQGGETPQETSVSKDAAQKAANDPKDITVKSPIIGTLYRKPSPDKSVFVEVG